MEHAHSLLAIVAVLVIVLAGYYGYKYWGKHKMMYNGFHGNGQDGVCLCCHKAACICAADCACCKMRIKCRERKMKS